MLRASLLANLERFRQQANGKHPREWDPNLLDQAVKDIPDPGIADCTNDATKRDCPFLDKLHGQIYLNWKKNDRNTNPVNGTTRILNGCPCLQLDGIEECSLHIYKALPSKIKMCLTRFRNCVYSKDEHGNYVRFSGFDGASKPHADRYELQYHLEQGKPNHIAAYYKYDPNDEPTIGNYVGSYEGTLDDNPFGGSLIPDNLPRVVTFDGDNDGDEGEDSLCIAENIQALVDIGVESEEQARAELQLLKGTLKDIIAGFKTFEDFLAWRNNLHRHGNGGGIAVPRSDASQSAVQEVTNGGPASAKANASGSGNLQPHLTPHYKGNGNFNFDIDITPPLDKRPVGVTTVTREGIYRTNEFRRRANNNNKNKTKTVETKKKWGRMIQASRKVTDGVIREQDLKRKPTLLVYFLYLLTLLFLFLGTYMAAVFENRWAIAAVVCAIFTFLCTFSL